MIGKNLNPSVDDMLVQLDELDGAVSLALWQFTSLSNGAEELKQKLIYSSEITEPDLRLADASTNLDYCGMLRRVENAGKELRKMENERSTLMLKIQIKAGG